MLRRIFTTLFITISFSTPLAAEDSLEKPSTAINTADETRDASLFFDEIFDDYQQELEVAKENGKQGVLIMFEMDNCPFCARMKATVLNHANVQDDFHKNFRIFSVDIDGDLEITDFKGKTTTQKDFALKSRVRATPVFQFYNLEGEPMKNGRLTGATKNKEEFLLLGQYIVDKQNEKLSFSRYKRNQKETNE